MPTAFFLFGNCTGLANNYSEVPDASLFNNYFENSSLTLALAVTSSVGDVHSTVTGDEVVLSAIALKDENADDDGDEFFFDAPVLGPAPVGDTFDFPAGARRLEDGVDTGTVADWEFADYRLPGDNTPTGGGFDGCGPPPADRVDHPRNTGGRTMVTVRGRSSHYRRHRDVTHHPSQIWPMICGSRTSDGDGDPATSDGILVDDAEDLGPGA